MDPVNILLQILHIFQLTLPYIFLGFFLANLIKTSPYFELIGLPMSALSRAANLPEKCATVFSLYLLNSWSALGTLSEHYQEKHLRDKEVIVTIIMSYFPKSINSIIFFLGPVAFSVFGIWIGGGILVIEFLICIGITMVGIIAGRMFLDPDRTEREKSVPIPEMSSPRGWSTCAGTLKHCLLDSIRSFYEVAIILIPTGAIIILLFNIGVQESFTSFLSPFLAFFHLPASSIMVFVAAFMSQVAAISATGTIAVQENLSIIQCLLIYALSRSLHLGIGQIKTGLPANIALFGNPLGLKVSIIDFSMVQGATALVVVLLVIVGGL